MWLVIVLCVLLLLLLGWAALIAACRVSAEKPPAPTTHPHRFGED